jgi:hypothetical protein
MIDPIVDANDASLMYYRSSSVYGRWALLSCLSVIFGNISFLEFSIETFSPPCLSMYLG